MASIVEEVWRHAQAIERDLHACLKEKDPSFPDIAQSLAQYRSACEDVLLQDYEFAVSKDTENRLWDLHGRTNARFRKELKYFQGAGRKKQVHQRKTGKDFLEFIKSGQRFYRGYIQRLASRYTNIRELELVAGRLTLSTLSADEPSQVSASLAHSVLLSCHQTIVRLGDLSRWREMQSGSRNRNWGPAVGYYDLARMIYPASGASHNQLAAISLVELNHIRAIYHLYRALAVEEPHPGAKGNLEMEFKKIEEAWSKGELLRNDLYHGSQVPGQVLIGWFMRLHARCYKGVDFPEHEELENEVLSQLALESKESSVKGILNKFVLINVAAEYFAVVRWQDDPNSDEIRQSFFFLQRWNVKTFSTLLRILSPELERFVHEDIQEDGARDCSRSVKLTAVARRLLPSLRQCNSWLVSNASILTAQVEDESLVVAIRELWKIYASALTLLASIFPVAELPSIEYLLDEDVDTLGFRPFDNEHTRRRYYNAETGSQKPRFHDQGVKRHHPNVEMYGRIRDFLTDGMFLQLQENTPIRFEPSSTTFVYLDEGVLSNAGHQATRLSTSVGREDITHVSETALADQKGYVDAGASQAVWPGILMDVASNRMVDDLVDSETTDEEGNGKDGFANNIGNAIPAHAANSRLTPNDFSNGTSYGLIGPSTALEHFGDLHAQLCTFPLPLLPSIYNSPFAPQPGETTPGSRPGTAKRMTPSFSQQGSQTRISLRQQNSSYIVDSSISIMPDPSNYNTYGHIDGGYHNQLYSNNTFQPNANYTSGQRASTTDGSEAYGVMDFSNFHSSSLDWGGSGRADGSTDVQTPPNGQPTG